MDIPKFDLCEYTIAVSSPEDCGVAVEFARSQYNLDFNKSNMMNAYPEIRDNDIELSFMSLIARSSDERVLAIQSDNNICDYLKEAYKDYQPNPQLERKVLTKELSNDVTISQLIVEFKSHLAKLLNDIFEFGYRTAKSWQTEIASVLISLNQSRKGNSKTYLADVKNTFGEKVYKDAIKLAKSIGSNQAQSWLSDFDLVIEICARAGMQTATVYKLAVAKV